MGLIGYTPSKEEQCYLSQEMSNRSMNQSCGTSPATETTFEGGTKRSGRTLTAQARNQWIGEPVTHPDVCVQFFARDRRRDRDNMLTTVLDCLREAGVIVNDNIAQFNGTVALLPAVIDQKERV